MNISYYKPMLISYSKDELSEALGPCQNQYLTGTFYTTTGNITVNVDGDVHGDDGWVVYNEGVGVGDFVDNNYTRGFVGFNINDLQGKTIVSATLRLYQANSIEGSPYTKLGNIIVDHFNFGDHMKGADCLGAALVSNIGTISNNTTTEWKTMDVTNYVQSDLNAGRTSSQYRLRFYPLDKLADGVRDLVEFESAENHTLTGNYPELVVVYK